MVSSRWEKQKFYVRKILIEEAEKQYNLFYLVRQSSFCSWWSIRCSTTIIRGEIRAQLQVIHMHPKTMCALSRREHGEMFHRWTWNCLIWEYGKVSLGASQTCVWKSEIRNTWCGHYYFHYERTRRAMLAYILAGNLWLQNQRQFDMMSVGKVGMSIITCFRRDTEGKTILPIAQMQIVNAVAPVYHRRISRWGRHHWRQCCIQCKHLPEQLLSLLLTLLLRQ